MLTGRFSGALSIVATKIDADGEKAKQAIRELAIFHRRSLGQVNRWRNARIQQQPGGNAK